MQQSESALVLVDIQNDFLPGGALAAPNGHLILPKVNRLIDHFDLVVASRDWHPKGHVSFEIWGEHCVQGTPGAEHPKELHTEKIAKEVLKGDHPDKDCPSSFGEKDLAEYLKARGVKHVYICGLVTDFCVKNTALDARKLGFETTLVRDASADLGDPRPSYVEMQEAGVKIVNTEEVIG